MRYSLRELKEKTGNILKMLNWSVETNSVNPNQVRLTNSFMLRDAIEATEELELFDGYTLSLRSSELFSVAGDSIKISNTGGAIVNKILTDLKEAVTTLNIALSKVIPDESQDSINIKLPPVNDFADLAQFSKDLHIAISQVLYMDEINSNVKIESVENGSIWLNVLVFSETAVSVVGMLAWAGAVVYKKILEGKMLEEKLRSMEIKNDSLVDVRETQKKLLAQLVQAEADHIQSQIFADHKPEDTERLKKAIKLLAGLLEKGAEIRPALMAPEKVANLFPNMKKLPSIESTIKQLKQ